MMKINIKKIPPEDGTEFTTGMPTREKQNENGVKTQHSTQYGAEKMALSQEHFHRPAEQAIDIVKDANK